jgi:hypothetical protein
MRKKIVLSTSSRALDPLSEIKIQDCSGLGSARRPGSEEGEIARRHNAELGWRPNRVGTKREYYLAPIDVCFELVGLIRVHWRGLAGGESVWGEIDRFFSRLQMDSSRV